MEKIKAFAREQGYDDVMYLTKWRGYDCYEPIFKDTEVAYVGLPLMIMVQGETIRMSTPDEALAQIREQN